MPSLQVVDLSPVERKEKSPLESMLEGFAKQHRQNQVDEAESGILNEIYEKYKNEGRDIEDAIMAIQTKPGLSPSKRVSAMSSMLEAKKINNDMQKAAANKVHMTPEQREDRKKRLMEEGMTENEAEEYLNASPGVQQIMFRQHNELKSRGLRGSYSLENGQWIPNQNQQQQPQQQQNPQNQQMMNQGQVPQQEQMQPEEEAWPEVPPPKGMKPNEVVQWGNVNQKENNKTLAEVKKKNAATKGIGVRLNLLEQYNPKVPDGAGRVVINPETGEPYGAAQLAKTVNKETQAYVKTLNDFLIDAKEYFGSRVTNFDVQSFKSRLPSLLNTADGRRMIIKQMQLMNDLQRVYDVEMENALKHYGRNASYSDIVNIVDERVAAKEAGIIDKLNNLNEASDFMDKMAKNPEKFKNTVMMQNLENKKFFAVPKNRVDEFKKTKKWETY